LLRTVQMRSGLSVTLSSPCMEPVDFLGDRFQRIGPGSLCLADYPQHADDAQIIIRMLVHRRMNQPAGCNVLIYGPPGTGKTEFARLIATEAGCRLLADAPSEVHDRLDSLSFAQLLLARSHDALLLLDEADDLVGTPLSREVGRGHEKYRLTQMLDESKVPTIWITNHLYRFEPALLRRFAFVVEMKVPPRSIRGRVFDDYLGRFTPSAALRERCVANAQMPPAVIATAARTLTMVCSTGVESNDEDNFARQALGRVIDNAARALGIDREQRTGALDRSAYRPEILHADCDLEALLAGLCVHPSARLCLFGPPGTGKTAFVHHLAEVLDRPLVVRRASDLLSRWVGGTEENIAAAFEEAKTEGAVLLFDEADSFLADRSSAERSWEVTQVNELLTQLEAFDGLFAAATNRIDQLDAASLRRFDFKVGFRPLRPDQAHVLLADLARDLGMPATPMSAFAIRSDLTPGDFANVRRQARALPPKTPEELVDRLIREATARRQPTASIGFVR